MAEMTLEQLVAEAIEMASIFSETNINVATIKWAQEQTDAGKDSLNVLFAIANNFVLTFGKVTNALEIEPKKVLFALTNLLNDDFVCACKASVEGKDK